MFQGLEHTAIATADPEKLAQWYVDYLEFHINHRYGGNVFVRGANGSMLEIIPSEGERSDDTSGRCPHRRDGTGAGKAGAGAHRG